MMASWVALSPHNKVNIFLRTLDIFYVELACSLLVCVGFLRVLNPPTTKNMQYIERCNGYSELSVGVNVNCGRLFVFGPVMNR